MSLTLHQSTAPVFQRGFRAMRIWFDKAEQHAAARKFDATGFLSMKLAPDMLPLMRQVQIATDTAKGCMSRLAGEELPVWPDDETSFADLRARLDKVLAHVEKFQPAQIDAGATREIVITLRNRDPLKFTAEDYVRHWAMPNFYFHATTAYALLRQAGVELGKGDYLAGR
jgi:uncharacterized protein